MKRIRRLAAVMVGIAVMVTTVPALAQEEQALEIPPAFAGIESRLEVAQIVYDLPGQIPPDQTQILTNVASADIRIREAVESIDGDRVVDEDAFDLDQLAAKDLEQAMVHAESLPAVLAALEQAAAALATADRIAAVRDYETFLALPADAVPRRDSIIAAFKKKLAQSDEALAKGHYAQAIEKAHQAWREVSGAILDYWTVNDPDGDLLPSDRENELGTDPNAADTDGDSLSDLVELLNTFTDPLTANTYSPEITDDQLDLDSDGLVNADEQRANTDPIEADTDGDTLTDGFEVNEYPSDPLLVDTDDDGLDDDSEFRIGTDPTNPDTDGDGILDGDETYTTASAGPGVQIAITGVGDVAKTLVITDESSSALYEGAAGLLSPAVDISTSSDFESAVVSFPFDPASVPGGDIANLAVGFYDEELGVLTPLPTTVDSGTGVATATTDHFTTFVLFYVPNWSAIFEAFDPGGGGGNGEDVFFDVALVLDSSGSMVWNDPSGLRRVAAKNFIDGLIEGDQVAVVDFDSFAILRQPLTTDFEAAKAAVDLINSSGGTNIGRGVTAAHNELINRGDPDHSKVEILLTDGQGAYSASLTQQAIDNQIVMYTIGLGNSVDAALLEGIATATGGEYFPVLTADDLPEVFDRIGDDLGDKDTDEDGLLDRWELEGMPVGSGQVIFTDPFNPDTDDDGLNDGDELVLRRDFSVPYPEFFFSMIADPREYDSDGDQLGDAEEVDMAFNALRPDEDGDGVLDGLEYILGFDPRDGNPDGDSYGDAQELANETDPFTFDPNLGDRTRALTAGALLGELGYWLSDRGVSTTISILWFPGPTLSVGFGPLDLCNIPFAPCSELVSFRPIDTEQVEYIVGMIGGSFIPFADLVVAIRDAIGAALQGEFGWAIFEIVAGASGFVAPLLGDVPNIVKDVGKWSDRLGGAGKKLDELIAAIAKLDVLDEVANVRIAVIKALKNVPYQKVSAKLDDADILRILKKGRQSLDELAYMVDEADEVVGAGKWFDETARRGTWGREAEDVIRVDTGGVSRRLDTSAGTSTGSFRVVDSLEDGIAGRIAHEVKTGDGRLDSRMRLQIRKDRYLLDANEVDDVVWHFFPSARSDRLGPTVDLLDELKSNGFTVIIHTP